MNKILQLQRKLISKQFFMIVGCCFICSHAWAQQNITGFSGNTGELYGVELLHYSEEGDLEPDTTYIFDLFSFHQMHELGYNELNDIVHGTLRFDANNIYASTLGSPESLMTVNLSKPYNPKTGEYGEATLTYRGDLTQKIEFYSLNGPNVWIVKYFFSEKRKNETQTEWQYSNASPDETQNLQKPAGYFQVLIHYGIK
jgi:hypothetical protein